MARDVAEWRQLTVVFCDLVDSTAMSGRLDPEDLREVNRAYQVAMTTCIERYGGFVARYMGDGVLAYFGYPRAHEDDPIRAVRAGLDAVQAMRVVEADLGARMGVKTPVRVGIATGRVVVGDLIGDGAAQEAAVVGATPNLAARLQGVAEPNQVVVAQSTFARLGGAFRGRPLGARALKGIAQPVELVAIEGPAEAAPRWSSDPLIGRSLDHDWLSSVWQRSADCARLALVGAEAGLGKSHLVGGFLADRPHLLLQASPWNKGTALQPLLEWARSRREQGPSWSLPQTGELVAWALGEGEEVEPGEAEKRAEALQTALIEEVRALAQEPFAVWVEDAHWLDPSTLDWITRLHQEAHGVPLVVIVSFRPSFVPPWSGPRVDRLDLKRLDPAGAQALITRVAEAPVAAEVMEHIVDRADGIPLYLEEITRTLLDSRQLRSTDRGWVLAGRLEELSVPETLQDSLMARLDQLGFARTVAQAASIIGRHFRREVLEHVAEVGGEELDQALERLVASKIVIVEGPTYLFRHALLQDTASQSLLRSRRRQLHGRVADVLLHDPEASLDRVAAHLEEAGRAGEAIAMWRRAAERSIARFANREAFEQLSRAHGLAVDLGDVELDLELMLARADRVRVLEDHERLYQLLDEAQARAEAAGSLGQLAAVHVARGNAHFHAGSPEECLVEHEIGLGHARAAGDATQVARALSGLGDANYLLGRFHAAEGRFEDCVATAKAHGLAQVEAANRPMLGWCAGWLGRWTDARERFLESIAVAEGLDHQRPLMVAHGGLALFSAVYGEPELARRGGQQAMILARRFESAAFEAMGEYYLGLLALGGGEVDEACRHAEAGMASVDARGGGVFANSALSGLRARTATREADLEAAEARGRTTLGQWQSRFWLFEGLVEGWLALGEPERAMAATDELEGILIEADQPYPEFVVARGRALARFALDPGRGAVEELHRIRARGLELHLLPALVAVDRALASV